LAWIDAEFGMGERSAQHLISVAEFVDSNPNHGSYLEEMSASLSAAELFVTA